MRLRLILLLPVLLLLAVFALSNTAEVPIGLWPTGISVQVPVSVAILLGMGVAFVLGAAIVWVASLGHRRRARRAEAKIVTLQAELAGLRAGGGLAVLPRA